MPVIHFYNGRERKIIGTLDPDKREFSKKVQTSKHLFRTLDAWGTDAQYFADVLLPNDYTLKFTDVEEHVRYTVSARTFAKNGQHYHFKGNGKDYGSQIFLPRRFWEKEKYEPIARNTPNERPLQE